MEHPTDKPRVRPWSGATRGVGASVDMSLRVHAVSLLHAASPHPAPEFGEGPVCPKDRVPRARTTHSPIVDLCDLLAKRRISPQSGMVPGDSVAYAESPQVRGGL